MTGLGASRMLDVLGKKMVERDFAAGIVVGKVGTATASARELMELVS